MSSAVRKLQIAVAESKEPLTPLLRQAKIIASSLGLDDVETWVDLELKGYPQDNSVKLPPYRFLTSSHVEINNPFRGWEFAGHFTERLPVYQPISDIEHLAVDGDSCVMPLIKKLQVRDPFFQKLAQRVSIPSSEFRGVAEAIRNELLQWTLELNKRGIKGEDMDFNEQEKAAATTQIFHIQKMMGIIGDVSGSTVNIYDYSSLHQMLKEQQVPQDERNKLENIMDQLKEAQSHQKSTLIEKGKQWIVKNKDFLGASAEIVKKAIGG